MKFKRAPSVFMYAMNVQNDVIGLLLRENFKSKQVTEFIAWPSSWHDTIYCYLRSLNFKYIVICSCIYSYIISVLLKIKLCRVVLFDSCHLLYIYIIRQPQWISNLLFSLSIHDNEIFVYKFICKCMYNTCIINYNPYLNVNCAQI